MSNSVRNTLILIILFLFITGLGVFRVHIYSGERLKEIEGTNEQKRKTLKEMSDRIKDYEYAEKVLEEMEEKWVKRERVLQKNETSGTTLAFLNKIISEKDSNVQFDFKFLDKKMEKEYGVSTYSINGEGFYDNIYRFIYKIENDRNLHMVKSLNLNGIEKLSEKTKRIIVPVNFSFVLDVYFNPDEDIYDSSVKNKFHHRTPVINPFAPLIRKIIPPNKKGLIEVENASIEAMSAEMVLVKDKKGRFKSLKVGDEVYLGYITAIYPEKGEAEFTLNKGGFIEKVVLKMFDKN